MEPAAGTINELTERLVANAAQIAAPRYPEKSSFAGRFRDRFFRVAQAAGERRSGKLAALILS
ncbi:hypothetical protein [Pararhizobium gei]|uniref:hypothetical protein n=1 Tax=Pararhizobium gei TaxID=1395951 RepID=UPI0023DC7283|nr:hypothetical protein [Rhizobium gei]